MPQADRAVGSLAERQVTNTFVIEELLTHQPWTYWVELMRTEASRNLVLIYCTFYLCLSSEFVFVPYHRFLSTKRAITLNSKNPRIFAVVTTM